nr:hypothetical protein [uncultured Neisseria sp.]
MTEMVKLQAPKGFTDVSFGSQSYEVDENGVVEVPVESAQFLYQFGFGNVAEETAEAEEHEKGKRGRKAKTEQAAEAVETVEAEQAEQPAEAKKTE